MNWLEIAKGAGIAAISSTPAGAAALALLNTFLPDDKKLPDTATGNQAIQVSETLAPDVQAELYKANINLQIEKERGQTERYIAMCQADNQQTRSDIVKLAMYGLLSISAVYVLALAYCMVKGLADVKLDTLTYAFIAASGPLAYVIRAYFGDLRTETESRHNAINGIGVPAKGVAGIVKAFKTT